MNTGYLKTAETTYTENIFDELLVYTIKTFQIQI